MFDNNDDDEDEMYEKLERLDEQLTAEDAEDDEDDEYEPDTPQRNPIVIYDRIMNSVTELIAERLRESELAKGEAEFLRRYFDRSHDSVLFGYMVDAKIASLAIPLAKVLSEQYSAAAFGRDRARGRVLARCALSEFMTTSTDGKPKTRGFQGRHALCVTELDRLPLLSAEGFARLRKVLEDGRERLKIFIGGTLGSGPVMRERLDWIESRIPLRRVSADDVTIDETAIVLTVIGEHIDTPDEARIADNWASYCAKNMDTPTDEKIANFVTLAIYGEVSGEKPAAGVSELHARRDTSAVRELDRLVGMDNLKETVKNIAAHCELARVKSAAGAREHTLVPSALFLGNPGTGKTMAAGIVARYYRELGLLERGHLVTASRESFIGEYTGWTAKKTSDLFFSALDGVLFVDEAYSLMNGPDDTFGREAIDMLTKLMSDFAGRCCVIFAGYESSMERLFRISNQGLRERFPFRIMFDDYNEIELMEIFTRKAREKSLTVQGAGLTRVGELIERICQNRDEGFANGRLADNILQEIILRQERRLVETRRGGGQIPRKELLTLTREDCASACAVFERAGKVERRDSAIGFRLPSAV
jgi:stage V sporulation protein K